MEEARGEREKGREEERRVRRGREDILVLENGAAPDKSVFVHAVP